MVRRLRISVPTSNSGAKTPALLVLKIFGSTPSAIIQAISRLRKMKSGSRNIVICVGVLCLVSALSINALDTWLKSPVIDPKFLEIVVSARPARLVISRAVTWSNGYSRSISMLALIRRTCASAAGTTALTVFGSLTVFCFGVVIYMSQF